MGVLKLGVGQQLVFARLKFVVRQTATVEVFEGKLSTFLRREGP